MKEQLLHQIEEHLYNSTLSVGLEFADLQILGAVSIEDLKQYEDSIELAFSNGSMITVSMNNISSVEAFEEPEGLTYKVISNNGWTAYLTFI